jgi:serine/threonine protein phosphatase PrpC
VHPSPGAQILCSDGLHGVAPDERIEVWLVVLRSEVPKLVALAREFGGPDNITAVLLKRVKLARALRWLQPWRRDRAASTARHTRRR